MQNKVVITRDDFNTGICTDSTHTFNSGAEAEAFATRFVNVLADLYLDVDNGDYYEWEQVDETFTASIGDADLQFIVSYF